MYVPLPIPHLSPPPLPPPPSTSPLTHLSISLPLPFPPHALPRYSPSLHASFPTSPPPSHQPSHPRATHMHESPSSPCSQWWWKVPPSWSWAASVDTCWTCAGSSPSLSAATCLSVTIKHKTLLLCKQRPAQNVRGGELYDPPHVGHCCSHLVTPCVVPPPPPPAPMHSQCSLSSETAMSYLPWHATTSKTVDSFFGPTGGTAPLCQCVFYWTSEH